MGRFTSMLITVFLCGFALPSAAYTEYVYQTGILPWEYTEVSSQPYHEPALGDGGELPSFGFSFLIDDNALSADAVTNFALNNINVWIDESFFGENTRELTSSSSGKVGIRPDGTVAFWELLFSFNEIVLPDSPPAVELGEYRVQIRSAAGAGTCNCDYLNNYLNVVTRRPYNTWIVAATIDNHFRDASDVNNWTASAVPLPATWLLLLSGVVLVVVRRAYR